MTDFDHAEISRRLALAIGWPEHKLYIEGDGSFCSINVTPPGVFGEMWKDFDYRSFDVIWPVAERFNAFPAKNPIGFEGWSVFFDDSWETFRAEYVEADTAALAVAMAVIRVKDAK